MGLEKKGTPEQMFKIKLNLLIFPWDIVVISL